MKTSTAKVAFDVMGLSFEFVFPAIHVEEEGKLKVDRRSNCCSL